VDVRIHLGASVFKQTAKAAEDRGSGGCVPARDCMARLDQGRALLSRVLVQDEDGKDIAEEHAPGNQSDTTENIEPARARGRERRNHQRRFGNGSHQYRYRFRVSRRPPRPKASDGTPA
jgi:hypothetical protein